MAEKRKVGMGPMDSGQVPKGPGGRWQREERQGLVP